MALQPAAWVLLLAVATVVHCSGDDTAAAGDGTEALEDWEVGVEPDPLHPRLAVQLSAKVTWSHLPVHRRGTVRVATLVNPDTAAATVDDDPAPTAYTWNNFEEQPADGRRVANGGILHRHRREAVSGHGTSTAADHAGVLSALSVALDAIPGEVAATAVGAAVWPHTPADALAASLYVRSYAVTDAFSMPLHFTRDGVSHAEAVYRVVRPVYARVEHQLAARVVLGVAFWLRLTTELAVRDAPDAPVASFTHSMCVFLDLHQDWIVHQHTFVPAGDAWRRQQAAALAVDAATGDVGDGATSTSIVLAVYNVWNTNPPVWLYGKPYHRWVKYTERMRLLGGYLLEHDPDIIAFQEVRFDSGLGPPADHSQLRHLLQLLPGYQYVWQPANVYFHSETFPSLDQEGCAIFSRYPIVHSDYMFPDGTLVDVYTTHLSLSEAARNVTVLELWSFVQSSRRGHLQLVTGDMNAEPDTAAIQFLQGLASLAGVPAPALGDAWLALHPEPEPRSTDAAVRREALTFPSDDPVKRIDLVLAGTPTGALPVGGASAHDTAATACTPVVDDVFLIGQEPLAGVGRETSNSGEHLGMVHRDSKVWASDHRGVITRLRFGGGSGQCSVGGATTPTPSTNG